MAFSPEMMSQLLGNSGALRSFLQAMMGAKQSQTGAPQGMASPRPTGRRALMEEDEAAYKAFLAANPGTGVSRIEWLNNIKPRQTSALTSSSRPQRGSSFRPSIFANRRFR